MLCEATRLAAAERLVVGNALALCACVVRSVFLTEWCTALER
jgi:hypothetical protein